ncbi:hypothetical protein Vadar_010735 [Vaccinium darrowii]|nr:hypothetical protein Vadar_010735 [Vaccinium darrowii]
MGKVGGGRRRRGLKEKLKEILPGKHKDKHAPQTHQTDIYPVPLSSTTPPGQHPHEHEKKGIMEKIKEKLPRTHHSH